MLTLFCNCIELLRIRQELILCLSETKLLEEVYDEQAKLVNRTNYKHAFND